MTFDAFMVFAQDAFEEIPALYREGVDGLSVRRDAPSHPDLEGVWTLGECLTEEHPSDFGSAETTRSVLALYWGAFREVAAEDRDFDWEGEIWETLTHELRHHLESLAGEDDLEGVDYAMDETFKRFDGQDFDPWYYQYGEEVEAGTYRVENAWYLEKEWTAGERAALTTMTFDWGDRHYAFTGPRPRTDVHFVLIHGIDIGDRTLEIVLVMKRSWWQSLRRLFARVGREATESEAHAEPLDGEG